MKTIDITNLQKKINELRTTAHRTQTDSDWELFRNTRNELKDKTKSAEKRHSTKSLWRRKIQKQFGERFIEFLNQILKDAPRHQHD